MICGFNPRVPNWPPLLFRANLTVPFARERISFIRRGCTFGRQFPNFPRRLTCPHCRKRVFALGFSRPPSCNFCSFSVAFCSSPSRMAFSISLSASMSGNASSEETTRPHVVCTNPPRIASGWNLSPLRTLSRVYSSSFRYWLGSITASG